MSSRKGWRGKEKKWTGDEKVKDGTFLYEIKKKNRKNAKFANKYTKYLPKRLLGEQCRAILSFHDVTDVFNQ